ncbi:MAG: L-threonine 3-dehydrogenase [Deltaproteobacteria bacterium]|nr:L-threonine 3-dehydrogenase [Deltaproteobacteria bacterium]
MSNKMKAIMKREPKMGAELVVVDIPEPSDSEVLVKVIATSICGTDAHIYKWDRWSQSRIKTPMIFGHEFAGEVVKIGRNVRGVKVGDFISAESHIPCGYCKVCRNGQMHICTNLKILGVDTQGCFAEYVVIPEICAWKNNKDMPPHIAAVQEPLGNAVYATLSSEITGRSVAIFGDGPAGLFSTGVARAAGASMIFLLGTYEFNLNIGKKMGASRTINVLQEVEYINKIIEETEGDGVDVVLEMSGAEKAINEGFKVLRKGGTFVAFGIPSDEVKLNFAEALIFKGANVIGINGREMFRTWVKMKELLNSKKLDPEPVITHQIPFEKFNEGFELMLDTKDHKAAKIVMRL